ncbi:MAG TPA: N-acetylmuramoyl-L-alanine amidase-like domain-containing protein [Thermodesulfobacteriota bacterium]|nr:N-acetylmuramoyl-L-alanine amidase-like domain-containing protein [Thermodesulfobacteriota bacterium]
MKKFKLTSHTYQIILTIIITISSFHFSAITRAQTGSEKNTTEVIELGKWTEGGLTEIMTESSKLGGAGARINFISEKFLGTPYVGSTLTGDVNTPETFTVDLEGMDCFTYIDYVESMSLSGSFPEFKDTLRKVRYRDGVVAFRNRNHFFSDWPINNYELVEDVTSALGGVKTMGVSKNLNLKSDGTYYLPGIPVINRTVHYIPSDALDASVLSKLMTGDFVGIYTDKEGLDVSHTGIIIKNDGKVFLRHASSKEKNQKVVDEILGEYMKNKPGLVVYRPVK